MKTDLNKKQNKLSLKKLGDKHIEAFCQKSNDFRYDQISRNIRDMYEKNKYSRQRRKTYDFSQADLKEGKQKKYKHHRQIKTMSKNTLKLPSLKKIDI